MADFKGGGHDQMSQILAILLLAFDFVCFYSLMAWAF